METDELIEMLTERSTMSKTMEEYGTRKSQAITTALRLAEFLGDEMIQGTGLNCSFLISRMPYGAKITERAIPVIIFKEEPAVRHHFLKKWLKDSTLPYELDVRDLLDWVSQPPARSPHRALPARSPHRDRPLKRRVPVAAGLLHRPAVEQHREDHHDPGGAAGHR